MLPLLPAAFHRHNIRTLGMVVPVNLSQDFAIYKFHLERGECWVMLLLGVSEKPPSS